MTNLTGVQSNFIATILSLLWKYRRKTLATVCSNTNGCVELVWNRNRDYKETALGLVPFVTVSLPAWEQETARTFTGSLAPKV